MKQSTLSFQPITADAAQQQRKSVAEQWAREHPDSGCERGDAPPTQRGPGRPRIKRPLNLEQAAGEQPTAQKPRTGKYTNWFSSPYISDVLRALRRHHYSAKAAVAALKRAAPDDRYERLSDSTVRSWFDKEHKLLPHFQQQLDDGAAAARSIGRPAVMATAVEDACKRALLQLRDAGVPVNCHVIRWTLQAVFRQHDPTLLDSSKLQLSHTWISNWVRTKLDWRWRQRTTAASKLPLTWEDEGVLMAKRIAANMEMHQVSSPSKCSALSQPSTLHCSPRPSRC
jgi:hypothetical protein